MGHVEKLIEYDVHTTIAIAWRKALVCGFEGYFMNESYGRRVAYQVTVLPRFTGGQGWNRHALQKSEIWAVSRGVDKIAMF